MTSHERPLTVVAVSPHLDDAAFSAGGELAALAQAGADVTVVTCFTATVPDPTGFALACQTDKGLGPEVDYMALRRDEDALAMAELGVRWRHLELPEAPHRGYDSPSALFAGVRAQDDAHLRLGELLAPLAADVWLAPQGLGPHVDHLQVVRAVAELDRPTAWWRDAPYVLREPGAAPSPDLPRQLEPVRLRRDPDARGRACARYATQLGFQFGRDSALPVLDALHAALARLDEPLAADARARALLQT